MNNTNNIQKASNQDLDKVTSLLQKAGLVSPTLRFLCETIIKTGDQKTVTQLILLLGQCIKEKEEAYLEYKKKMISILNKKLEILASKNK